MMDFHRAAAHGVGVVRCAGADAVRAEQLADLPKQRRSRDVPQADFLAHLQRHALQPLMRLGTSVITVAAECFH